MDSRGFVYDGTVVRWPVVYFHTIAIDESIPDSQKKLKLIRISDPASIGYHNVSTD